MEESSLTKSLVTRLESLAEVSSNMSKPFPYEASEKEL